MKRNKLFALSCLTFLLSGCNIVIFPAESSSQQSGSIESQASEPGSISSEGSQEGQSEETSVAPHESTESHDQESQGEPTLSEESQTTTESTSQGGQESQSEGSSQGSQESQSAAHDGKSIATAYTVDEMIEVMSDYTVSQESTIDYYVTGKAITSYYDSTHSSFTCYFENHGEDSNVPFQLYSGVLSASLSGSYSDLTNKTLVFHGRAYLFQKNNKNIYEIAYVGSGSKINPTIDMVVDDGGQTETSDSTNPTSESTSSETSVIPPTPQGYYEGADISSPIKLFSSLRTIISSNFHSIGYDNLWKAYETVDKRPDGYLQDIYSDMTNYKIGGSAQGASYKQEGDAYNREHTIPQSWWGKGTANQGCDIFIVYPSDGYINNMRSNYSFGEVDTISKQSHNGFCKFGTSAISSYSESVFEPADKWKGDMARAYFYALTRWSGAYNWTSDKGSSCFSGSTSKNFGLTDYAKNLFLKWHRDDPPDEWEIGRNGRAQAVQGNRNPYIDNPEWADFIWG